MKIFYKRLSDITQDPMKKLTAEEIDRIINPI